MTFGEALDAMKAGKKVSRAGWNGKSMWVALTPGTHITDDKARAGAAALLVAERNAARDAAPAVSLPPIAIGAHIDMRAADGSLVIGWLASQTDMLASDWDVVP